jgi:integrase
MSIRVTQTKKGKRYAARVHLGNGKYKLLETRGTRKEAKEDEAQWLLSKLSPEKVTTKAFARRYLVEYGEKFKLSSYQHTKRGIDEWLKTFGNRTLRSIRRQESLDWASENRWAVPPVVTMLSAAVDERLVERNEMRGQSRRTRGRADMDPLTEAQVARLSEIARETHGKTMSAFITFAAYTGLRVGEMFALEWRDIDFKENRVKVDRRLYRGTLDLPKSNKRRKVVLLPEARDALLPLDRSTQWVFPAKRGGQMSQDILVYYWQKIVGRFSEPVTPHELRHFCAHHLYVTKQMEARVVAAQLGHSSPRLVELNYGHGSVGALEQLEAAYGSNVRHLKVAEG